MKKTILTLSLAAVTLTALCVSAPAYASFGNSGLTFDDAPKPARKNIPPTPGTFEEGLISLNTESIVAGTNDIKRDTKPQSPSEIAAAHARAVAQRLRDQQNLNTRRAAELRERRAKIRRERQPGQDDNETAATSRTQRQTDTWSAKGPKLLTSALSEVVMGVNRDPQTGTGNPLGRIERLKRGPGCHAVDLCGADASDYLTPRDQFALFMARACNSLNICDQYGGTDKDIAFLRAKHGLPMFAAVDESGKLKAVPIAAGGGGGGDDFKGSAVQPDQFKTADGCEVEAGKCLDAIVTTALVRVGFVAPDLKAENDSDRFKKHADYRVMGDDGMLVKAAFYGGGANGREKKNYLLAESETLVELRTIEALQRQAQVGDELSRVSCMVGGALRPSQKGPTDDKMDNLMNKAGTPRNKSTGGYSQRDRQKLNRAQIAQRNAGTDSEARTPAERIGDSEDSRKTAAASADKQSESGQNCPQSVASANSGPAGQANLGPLKLFYNPQVIAWMNDKSFKQRVIAFRTVLPEIYAAENEVIDRITTAEMTNEFGEKYAQYALEQKHRNEEYMLSLNNQLKQFGVNPTSYLPAGVGGNDANIYAMNAIAQDAQPALPTFVASIVPDIIKNDAMAVADAKCDGCADYPATPVATAPVPFSPLDNDLSTKLVSRMMATPIAAEVK